MAEEEATIPTEVEAEEPPETPGYKVPAKKTLEEIQKLDGDDESLQRYKAQLLAGAEGAVLGMLLVKAGKMPNFPGLRSNISSKIEDIIVRKRPKYPAK